MSMVEIQVPISEELAKEAKKMGLLSTPSLESLLEEGIRRQRARDEFADYLSTVKDDSPITEEELAEIIQEVRKEMKKNRKS